MAGIEEEETWDTDVYQLETTDPVQGGPDGVDNVPHKALANRTLWLKAQLLLKGLKGGSATQLFKVKAGVAGDDAVNKTQMESALSDVGDLSDMGTSLAEDGYMKLSNGLILQWGVVNASGATTTDFLYPISFVNGVFNLSVTMQRNDTSTPSYRQLMTFSLTGATIHTYNSGDKYHWLAIGY